MAKGQAGGGYANNGGRSAQLDHGNESAIEGSGRAWFTKGKNETAWVVIAANGALINMMLRGGSYRGYCFHASGLLSPPPAAGHKRKETRDGVGRGHYGMAKSEDGRQLSAAVQKRAAGGDAVIRRDSCAGREEPERAAVNGL